MPTSFRVKTRFQADDKVSRTALKIEKNTRRMNKSIKRGFRDSTKAALGFQGVMKGILAASTVQKGVGLLNRGLEETARQFISFDDSITAAAVRFKDIGPDSANFAEQLQTIKNSAREAGATTVFTATQASQALDFLARAGFKSTEAMNGLNSMINLSIATGEDFARAADISSDLLGAFGLAVDDPIKKIANLNKLNDVLVLTANSANVTLEDMFETMKDVGPIATQLLGSNLEEVSAITAALGDAGLKGTKAMTGLRGIMLSLSAPTSGGAKALKALGISMTDVATGKPRKIIDVMRDFREQTKDFDKIKKTKVMQEVFGKIPLASAATFLRDLDKIDKFFVKLKDAEGTSKKVADVIQKSLGNRIKGLGSALNELGFKILDPLEGKIKNNITALTEFFRSLNPQPFIDGLTETVRLLKFITNLVITLMPVLKPLIAFWVTYKTVLLAAAFAQKAMTVATIAFAAVGAITTFLQLASSVRSMSEAMALFNIVMAANPVIAILAGVVALGVAIAVVVKNWDSIVAAIKAAIDLTKKFLGIKEDTQPAQTTVRTQQAIRENAFLTRGNSQLTPLATVDAPEQPTQPNRSFRSFSPNMNVNIENQINAKDVEVNSTVKPPGTKQKIGRNSF